METIPEDQEIPVYHDLEGTSPSHLEEITLDTDTFSETLQSPGLGLRSMCGRTAKEYEEQLRVLKKENFNLKLRIYFLEERMTRFGRPGVSADEEDAERKLIELKVELEGLKREMRNKQLLLAQAGKAVELMEQEHSAEMNKLRQQLEEFESRAKKPAHPADPHDTSMQLYMDAFNLRPSMLIPPTSRDQACQGEPSNQTVSEVATSQQQVAELSQQLQQCLAELEESKERERNLCEALDSKEPDIQIKIQELNEKDAMLAEQRKIIVEIEIKLDEKQKQLEALRQQLEATHATVVRHEAEQAALQQRLRESEEKRGKAVKVVQNLMARTNQLGDELRAAQERHSKAEWEARQHHPDELGEMACDESERLWTQLEQLRGQVEQMGKENSALLREKCDMEVALRKELADLQLERASRPSLDHVARAMFGRLDELAAFLATFLKQPHLLTKLSAADRGSVLQALHESWHLARRRFSTSMQDSVVSEQEFSLEDASLVGKIQVYLNGSEHEDLVSEVEAERVRSTDLCPVSISSDVGGGKELELINWGTSRMVQEEDEEEGEEGGGATAVEREPPGSYNQSESEAWSEPDRSVSQARIGLPDSCTPVAQPERAALVSPASSEADLTARTPGKRASVRRLANKLRDTEQINEALRAELGAYQVIVKHSSPVQNTPQFAAANVLQEMENQRSRLESLLKQNDIIRQQLENARLSNVSPCKGDDLLRLKEAHGSLEASRARVKELEAELACATSHWQTLQAQMSEREALHELELGEVQRAVAALKAREAQLQGEVEEARAVCQQLEQHAQQAAVRSQELEAAAARHCEAKEQLALQLEQVEASLQAQKPITTDSSVQTLERHDVSFANSTGPSSLIHLSDCDDVFQSSVARHDDVFQSSGVARQALSSPDLGIESDNGRMSSLESPPSPPAHGDKTEIARLKQKLAASEQLMESCLAALHKKNKARKQLNAAMRKQLQQTEEVLCVAKANLLSLAPASPPRT